jgi:uncharacterized Fe-S radical SAM superfamily protein PflX
MQLAQEYMQTLDRVGDLWKTKFKSEANNGCVRDSAKMINGWEVTLEKQTMLENAISLNTKSQGSSHMCEANFLVPSITIYNMWCLLWNHSRWRNKK